MEQPEVLGVAATVISKKQGAYTEDLLTYMV
jgi:hypothetical protein